MRFFPRLRLAAVLCAFAVLCSASAARAQGGSYVNFETIPNRALALSPNGQLLFATNTPASRLEIFRVTDAGLVPQPGVQVGLDPIAVAARSDTEVWVVNHVSDSVSVVDLSGPVPRVVRTLLVGDEPRDIVFAGPDRSRAFITAARRGQNHPANILEEQVTPGIGRADVWVFDAADPGSALGGKPITILQLFGDKPGALAVSPDGRSVFAGIFRSGNETTVISEISLCGTRQDDGPCVKGGKMMPGGVPAPNQNAQDNQNGPLTGIIVKFDRATGSWLDVAGRDWRNAVPFTLPDRDVFVIDAMANPPVSRRSFQHVGTLNAGMAVNPSNQQLYVANLESRNLNRFLSFPGMNQFPNPRGPVKTADPLTGKTLNGHIAEARISVLSPDGTVRARHLNKHIDYEVVPAPAGVRERSIALPHSVAFSPDGETLFVAALGSNQIARFRTREIDDDSFVPSADNRIALSGAGPTNLVVADGGKRGFVYTRFDNAIETLDLAAGKETARVALASPEPAQVTRGRRFFYDSTQGSSNGEAACAACHPSADKDDLAWDLGTPFSGVVPNRNPFALQPRAGQAVLNPLKGPKTVLTLRGIKDSGPLFWRGEKTSADSTDVAKNFQGFGDVFTGLLGRDGRLPAADFAALTDWALTLVPPPNPIRRLDNSLSESQQAGMALFNGRVTDGVRNCGTCHATDPRQGFFGTRGLTVNEDNQNFKIPHFRNMYDKVGMFGRTDMRALRPSLGDQVRGTGVHENGSQGNLLEFLSIFSINAAEARQIADFAVAFPSNLAPIVGQQVTLRADSGADTRARVALLMQRGQTAFVLQGKPDARECDVVVKGVVAGRARGFLMLPDGRFQDDASGSPMPAAQLLALAGQAGQELTFTCVYPGGGRRLGIDANEDGRPDSANGAPADSTALILTTP